MNFALSEKTKLVEKIFLKSYNAQHTEWDLNKIEKTFNRTYTG